jgi:hypothetical protein
MHDTFHRFAERIPDERAQELLKQFHALAKRIPAR